jgi:uncharacterized protein YecE (DUF72 family)
MRVWLGTSGYNYPEWKGRFYPGDLPASKMLPFYAARFPSVEINYTFYRMPTPRVLETWAAETPESFRLTLKASRRITHDRRLKDAQDLIAGFCETAATLGNRLGAVLFQTPPNLKCDLAALDGVLDAMPPRLTAAFEFRHDSWLNDAVYDRLRQRNVALCVADTGERTVPLVLTADYGYLRLRDEGYDLADIEAWADCVASHAGNWREVFVYFKHEDEGKGPEFAAAMSEALARRGITTG